MTIDHYTTRSKADIQGITKEEDRARSVNNLSRKKWREPNNATQTLRAELDPFDSRLFDVFTAASAVNQGRRPLGEIGEIS